MQHTPPLAERRNGLEEKKNEQRERSKDDRHPPLFGQSDSQTARLASWALPDSSDLTDGRN